MSKTAKNFGDIDQIKPPHITDSMLAVAGVDHILRFESVGDTDLTAFLPPHRNPESELSLPLQGICFAIDKANIEHFLIKLLKQLGSHPIEIWSVLIWEFFGGELSVNR